MTDNGQIKEALTTKKQPNLATPSSAEEASRITIHRLYAKNQQFVMNGLPDELSSTWNPQISLQANPHFSRLDSGQHEVVLTLHLSAQQGGKAIFQIQLEQAGLFTLQNVPVDQQETVLYGVCPNALFPYAAVLANQMLSQAGLPHVYLNPLDFIALYREHQKQQMEKQDSKSSMESTETIVDVVQ